MADIIPAIRQPGVSGALGLVNAPCCYSTLISRRLSTPAVKNSRIPSKGSVGDLQIHAGSRLISILMCLPLFNVSAISGCFTGRHDVKKRRIILSEGQIEK